MMVGLSLMKSSSCRTSVSEPNTSTMTAVTSGMTGKCRVSAYDTASASTTATMNTAVATKIPVCSPEAISAGSTVELGHDKPGDGGDVAKDLDLGERILPDRCVEHQQNDMRHGGVDLLHHAHDLLQLVHQHRLVLQATGGVDEQHVYFLAPRLRERVENEPGGVGARGARDHRPAAAPTPDVELVDGGRAESIAGGEPHPAP